FASDGFDGAFKGGGAVEEQRGFGSGTGFGMPDKYRQQERQQGRGAEKGEPDGIRARLFVTEGNRPRPHPRISVKDRGRRRGRGRARFPEAYSQVSLQDRFIAHS